MASGHKPYKAFVSSTFIDLKDHRAHVINSLRNAGFFVDPMENWAADSDEPKQFSQDRLAGCDLCLLLVGFRRGFVPDGEIRSITQLEYDAALAQGIDVLVFQLDDNAKWWSKYDDREKDSTLQEWRGSLGKKHGVEFFTDDPCSIDMTGALGRWLTKKNGGQSELEKIQRIEWPDGKSPYPGLFSFDLDYAPLFFGRDRDVDAVLAKMSQASGRFLVISGASGSGKSSLVAAGIRRAVNGGRLTGAKKVVWVQIQPGRGKTPFESLSWPLIETFHRISFRPGELASQLANGTQTIGSLLDAHLPSGQELLLFVDQLEELFTTGFTDHDVEQFLKAIVTASQATPRRLRVIGTVRSEFIARLQETEAVLDAMNGCGSHFLGPISPKALHEMIEKPAQATGYEFEPGLVDELLREAAQEPGSLPLVTYAMNQLFGQLNGGERTFTHKAYHAIGRVAGAIGTQADRVLQGLGRDIDAAFNRVFAELVNIERDRPPTRKRVSVSHFSDDKGADRLIEVLTGQDCRVLVTAGEGSDATVEVAHEKLFSAWPKLKEWIDRSGEDLRLIDYVEEAARRWDETGCHLKELWRRERAEAVRNALKRFNKTPSSKLLTLLEPQVMLIKRLDDASLSHEDRLLIGQKLCEFGDPRRGVGLKDGLPDIVWIDIPGGEVKLESVDHVFLVKPFRIAKYPVTNEQFQAFLTAEDGYRSKKWWKDLEQSEHSATPSWAEGNCPRETVSWYEAVAFCRWLSAKTNKARSSMRLPTEWEWQQAATGGDLKRKYPWEGGWDDSLCNSSISRLNRTTAVGVYHQGATQQGVLDMVGNVWEWCLNNYDHPEAPDSLRIDENAERALRGGSWKNTSGSLCVSFRHRDFTYIHQDGIIGFRLAQDIEP